MRILGIDPGYGLVGFGVVDKVDQDYVYIGSGVIRTDKTGSFVSRLAEIKADLVEVIAKYKPAVCSVEQLFFAKNTTTAMKVAEARGVIMHQLHVSGLEIYEFTPLQVKSALTGNGRASKQDVKKMVELSLKADSFKGPDDAIDALAIAITCGQSYEHFVSQQKS